MIRTLKTKKYFKIVLLLVFFLNAINAVYAQDSVHYTVHYNTATMLYEVKGKPNFTFTYPMESGSQISILLPSTYPNVPLTVTSVNGGSWSTGSFVPAPAASPLYDFHGVYTGGTGVPDAPVWTSGVELTLFTFALTGGCVAGVRVYINGTDPIDTDPGMGLNDFSNYIGRAGTVVITNGLDPNITGTNYNNSGIICSAPFPITIKSLNAYNTNCITHIEWETAMEENIIGFTILESENGLQFHEAGYVVANNTPSKYSFSVNNTITGNKYYKLKIREIDATVKETDVIKVWSTCNTADNINIYPNPTNNNCTVAFVSDNEKNIVLKLTDISGRVLQIIQAKSMQGNNKLIMDVQTLASGIYNIQLYENDVLKTTKQISKID